MQLENNLQDKSSGNDKLSFFVSRYIKNEDFELLLDFDAMNIIAFNYARRK